MAVREEPHASLPSAEADLEGKAEILIRKLVSSYASLGGINHLDGKNLPSKGILAGITADLVQLLFPGYFGNQIVRQSEIKDATRALLKCVIARLESEINKSLNHTPPDGLTQSEVSKLAAFLTLEFLTCLPSIRELLDADITAAFEGDPAASNKEEVILAYPFIETIAVQRMAHQLYRMSVPLIPRMMTEWAHSRTGIDLHPGAQIGTHFFIDHGTGTVIGESAEIGNHVKMYHGVGLVAKSLSAGQALRGAKRHPTICDRVTVYAGSTILGGDTVIGAGSTIGAGVFLTASVPAHSLVIMEGSRVRVMSKVSTESVAPDFQI